MASVVRLTTLPHPPLATPATTPTNRGPMTCPAASRARLGPSTRRRFPSAGDTPRPGGLPTPSSPVSAVFTVAATDPASTLRILHRKVHPFADLRLGPLDLGKSPRWGGSNPSWFTLPLGQPFRFKPSSRGRWGMDGGHVAEEPEGGLASDISSAHAPRHTARTRAETSMRAAVM